jgi:hypothetical protein
MRETSIAPDIGTTMFGCHKGAPGTDEDLACTGWLAVAGSAHPAVRLAVLMDRLDPAALARAGPACSPRMTRWPQRRGLSGERPEPRQRLH